LLSPLTFGKSRLVYYRYFEALRPFSRRRKGFETLKSTGKEKIMADLLSSHEATVRLIFFFGILALIGVIEMIAPRRPLMTSKLSRWFGNLGVVVISALLLRLVFPITAVRFALWTGENGWGLFNAVELPYWLVVVLSVIILDFIIYLQHVMFHAVPTLWRLHMMHHADLDYHLGAALLRRP
jgi:sterol desaturase/sphingolipid hydroxylase (fatty acid hydroxylase superfamily)